MVWYVTRTRTERTCAWEKKISTKKAVPDINHKHGGNDATGERIQDTVDTGEGGMMMMRYYNADPARNHNNDYGRG